MRKSAVYWIKFKIAFQFSNYYDNIEICKLTCLEFIDLLSISSVEINNQ